MSNLSEVAESLHRWMEVSHHIPGRIRLRCRSAMVAGVVSLKSADIIRKCESVTGITECSLNSGTGSILISYDPSEIPPEVLDGLFSESEEDVEKAVALLKQKY